jgi:cytochrome b
MATKKNEPLAQQLQPIQIIGLSLEQYSALLQESTQIAINNYFNSKAPLKYENDEVLLETKEVLKMLHISATTLIQRDKDGIFHPMFTGHKKLYKKSEIMNAIQGKEANNE